MKYFSVAQTMSPYKYRPKWLNVYDKPHITIHITRILCCLCNNAIVIHIFIEFLCYCIVIQVKVTEERKKQVNHAAYTIHIDSYTHYCKQSPLKLNSSENLPLKTELCVYHENTRPLQYYQPLSSRDDRPSGSALGIQSYIILTWNSCHCFSSPHQITHQYLLKCSNPLYMTQGSICCSVLPLWHGSQHRAALVETPVPGDHVLLDSFQVTSRSLSCKRCLETIRIQEP